MTIRVKLSVFPDWPLERQTHSQAGRWGDCEFYINEHMDECDYWVVYTGLYDTEICRCPTGRTLFVTYEPSSVHTYNDSFLAQFDSIITCQRGIEHPDVFYTQQGQHWFAGIDYPRLNVLRDYDEFKSVPLPEKTNVLSLISSAKDMTHEHRSRSKYIYQLIDHFGDRLHVYGPGFRPLRDKLDAIAPYRYHVVLENSAEPDYWSEKLADTYLGGAYPLYKGCPNLSDYFDPLSFTTINSDVRLAIDTIEKVIADDIYSSRVKAVAAARDLILDRYNLFAYISEYIEQRVDGESLLPVRRTLHDERHYTDRSLGAQALRNIRSIYRVIIGRNQPEHYSGGCK